MKYVALIALTGIALTASRWAPELARGLWPWDTVGRGQLAMRPWAGRPTARLSQASTPPG